MDVSRSLSLAHFQVQVILERKVLSSPWQSHQWEVVDLFPAELGVNPKPGQHARLVDLGVFQDELQGYFLNLDGPAPKVHFCLRGIEANFDAPPIVSAATLSSDEAARWMDSDEEVQTVQMPLEIAAWLSELVQEKFKPEPKRRRRPQSFIPPEKRETL